MSSRQQWLDAGLATLAAHGAPAVTIERLCGLLGLSKGSFYHHFGGMSAYRTALLERFEAAYTTRYITAVEQQVALGPRERLEKLLDLVLAEGPVGGAGDEENLEVAIRAWAQQDPDVRAAQERVDGMRTGYLRELWLEVSGDPVEADRMGWLLYVILVGSAHVIPPVGKKELRAIYALALREDTVPVPGA